MEILHTPPVPSSYTSLVQHQSRTPVSFYEGPPVLHYHSGRCKVIILRSDLKALPALNTLRGPTPDSNGGEVNGSATAITATAVESNDAEPNQPDDEEVVVDDVDIWVASDKLILYRAAIASGVAILYPQISLHAIQRLNLPDEVEQTQGLFMQIANPSAREADGTGEDDEEECVTLTVVPPPVLQSTSSALSLSSAGAESSTIAASDMVTEVTEVTDQILATADDNKSETPAQTLFAALSACSNLHPDPIQHDGDDDSEDGDQYSSYSAIDQGTSGGSLLQTGLAIRGSSDGGLPPPIEGSSGWITADNLHEYFDEEGNWIGEGEAPSFGVSSLGPGAGSMHPRDGNDHTQNGGEQADYGNDAAYEGEEAKWRRTH